MLRIGNVIRFTQPKLSVFCYKLKKLSRREGLKERRSDWESVSAIPDCDRQIMTIPRRRSLLINKLWTYLSIGTIIYIFIDMLLP